MRSVRRAAEAVARALELALALALIGAVLLNFVNVVGRYGFGSTMTIADELQTYAMVWIAFLGAAVVTWRGVHLRMDVIAQRLPSSVKQVLSWIEAILVLVLGVLVTWVAWQYVAQMYSLGARSQTAGIPMWIPHSALLVGFALTVVASLLRQK
jgi:TRAP-type C4-dicarboxylate transport system permease small subunit